MMSRTLWRVGQWSVGLAIVTVAVVRLARNWEELRQQRLDWELRPAYLAAALLLTWAMYAVLIGVWRAVLRSWGAPIGGYTAARIWTISSLGKYLPGKVWAIAGMAVMAQRAGVPPWAATGAAVLLQALSIAAGAAVVGVTGLAPLESAYPWLRPALIVIALASGAGIALLLWRPFTDRLFRLAGVVPERVASPRPMTLLAAFAANLVAWVGYGGSLWLLARGVLPETALDLPVAIGAFTASYLAGFLALIAPGGLLVREGTLFLMLQGAVGPAAAAALAIASRIMLTFTEFGAAVPFVVRPGETTRVVNSRTGNSVR
jgi:glycosyltransferase 2 family protein